MTKYRKKPVCIEAFRIGIDPIPDWFMDEVTARNITIHSDREVNDPFDHDHKTYCNIKTLEGVMRGDHGDYIIQGVNDEIYPCKPDRQLTLSGVRLRFTDIWRKEFTPTA